MHHERQHCISNLLWQEKLWLYIMCTRCKQFYTILGGYFIILACSFRLSAELRGGGLAI